MRRALVLLVLLGACEPDFIEAWEVTKPRQMVAKLSIDGDTEGRTRPRPGETFSLRFYLMSPSQPRAVINAGMELCLGTVLGNGSLACLQQIPSDQVSLEIAPYEGDDQILVRNVTVPALLDDLPPPFDQLDRLGLFGAMCVDGDVERVPGKDATRDATNSIFRCVNNKDARYPLPLPFTMAIFLDRDGPGSVNHNPSFACDEADPTSICNVGVETDREQVPGAFVIERPQEEAGAGPRTLAWPAWDESQPLPWDNCVDADLPKVHAGSKEHKLRVRFDPSDREVFERNLLVNGKPKVENRREELIVAHALTTEGGELDGFNSAVLYSDSDENAEIEVEYLPPRQSKEEKKRIPDTGRLVRFYFALRDRRSGTDFTTRELCLLPPTSQSTPQTRELTSQARPRRAGGR